MKTNKKLNLEICIMILLLVFLIAILSFAASLLSSYRSSLLEQTEKAALSSSLDYISEVNSKLELALLHTKEIATVVSHMSSTGEITRYLNNITQTTERDISIVRFYNDGKVYDIGGHEIDLNDSINRIQSEKLQRLIAGGVAGCTGLIYDSDRYNSMAYIAFYAPIIENASIDGIVTYYMIPDLFGNLVSFGEAYAGKSEYLSMSAADGTVILEVRPGSFPENKLTNVYESLREITNDKSVIDDLRHIVAGEGVGSRSFEISGTHYSMSVTAASSADNTLFITTVYNSAELYSDGFEFIENISVSLVVFLVIVTIGLIYMTRARFKSLEKIKTLDTIDPLLGCNTFKKFSLDTEIILNKNKVTKFAIIYAEVEQFNFLVESYDNIVGDDVLRFLAKVYKTSILQEETYGHISDDKFVLLMNYSNENDLMNRLKVIHAIVFNYSEMKKNNTNMKLSMGAYCIDRAVPESVQKMLDRAIMAQKTNTHNTTEHINIYNEKVRNNFMREAEIESRKETALAENEFRVFYQPKYNIAQNRPDGAEALVRWYDAETNSFRNPAEFVPIFESNGFIGKLDRYVLVEVCKQISESVERGYKTIPISVNVSRVTATQDGFVDFYIRTKRKYNVANNFLTIEFTESFAFENYDILKDMINKFKANGINCSIDHFGSGYSSYNILKELPMDELKLDSFFITKGVSKERDDELLSTIIKMAKNFGMKVTQEGVEIYETVERLEKFGCDVIQGYYYSKPLALDDFIAFINNGGAVERF